jgi:hypothetical protein
MATPYGIGVRWIYDVLRLSFRSGITRNKITINSMAIKCTVVAARWAHIVGNNHPYSVFHRHTCRNHLRGMGLPPNLQCAPVISPHVNRDGME